MRIHDELLELIEHSGPFLTTPVLDRVFPQGMDALDREHAHRLASAREEWAESQRKHSHDADEVHGAWIQFVLRETLGYRDENLLTGDRIPEDLSVHVAEHRERIIPDLILADVAGSSPRPRLLIHVYPASQELDGTIAGREWSASPQERMTLLCRNTGVRLGLITNGERWMLVDAPVGETAGYASWFASLWNQETLTLRAFQALLGARRFFGVAETDTLEAMLTESVAHQQEVTDRLGTQVRQAVELLVQSLDRADITRNRELLKGVSPRQLYDAALTVMMRLVFLFCAEERGLLLLGDPVYDAHYAVSTLRCKLREEADQIGLEVVERRFDAWARLLSTFRAIFGGIQHETLLMPALGGSLLDPDRYPFLEGREEGTSWIDTPAHPLPIDNRTVLHLLESLQVLRMSGGSARQLSFRALDIEQIGHVYEGLLDHVAIRVDQVTLGLSGAQGKEPELALEDLESKMAEGIDELVSYLKTETKRSKSALENALEREPSDEDRQRLLVACANDEDLAARVAPFHALLRDDVWGYPVVYQDGAFMVTEGTERRESGTHYTSKVLTEPIVQHTLEPLVYEGPADGKPAEEWVLRSPSELLDLKICDMAMGSAAFLVQTCRWLGERLVESWEAAEAGGFAILADGQPIEDGRGQELLPPDRDERLLTARRLIAERCIYGVDINPMAVELAKLSIWLITMSKGRPFAFLDHNMKCGDSLLGIDDVDQLLYFHADPKEGKKLHTSLFDPKPAIREALDRTLALRQEIREIEILDIEDVRRMQKLNAKAEEALERTALIADSLSGVLLSTAGETAKKCDQALVDAAGRIEAWLSGNEAEGVKLASLAREALDADCPEALKPRRPFHWAVQFPEVFSEGGFHAVVGNPPFMFGKYVSARLGADYNSFIAGSSVGGSKNADLCAHFFRRAFSLMRDSGCMGYLSTSSIREGETRGASLEHVLGKGGTIFRALTKAKWPGGANVYVCTIHIARSRWRGKFHLDEQETSEITAYLTTESLGEVRLLKENKGIAFFGVIPNGDGFFLDTEEAESILRRTEASYQEVVLPFLVGRDLNACPTHEASRYAVCFWNWPIERAQQYPEAYRIVEERVRPHRESIAQTKPALCERWWTYEASAKGLYQAIGMGGFFEGDPCEPSTKEVLAISRVSSTNAFAFVPSRCVFDNAVIVVARAEHGLFAVLQSSVHFAHAWHYGGKLKADLRYGTRTCFMNFAFPMAKAMSLLESVGKEFRRARDSLLLGRQIGLTALANLVNDASCNDEDITDFRARICLLDLAVIQAYGWDDIQLEHNFHSVGYLPAGSNTRYTISEPAREELLRRLASLNCSRFEADSREK